MDTSATRDWDHADTGCRASGPGVGSTRLAVDNTDQTHPLLTQLMASVGGRVAWLNAEYVPKYWSWLYSYDGML